MTNQEQTQADLLDQFRQNRDGSPPAELDSGVAATAVMLQEHLSPPAPSAHFVQNLGRRLDAEMNHSGNHRQTGTLPPLPDQTIPPSTPPGDRRNDSADEPRHPWFIETARIAAAGLAIALVGAILLLVFRDAESVIAPGAGVTGPQPGEILISWDPTGGEDYKLFMVDTDGESAPRKLTPGPFDPDGVSERYPSWSPDGRRVAFVREEDGQSDIFVMDAMDAANRDPVNITNSLGNESAPVWSPGGSQIAFNREGGEPFAAIYVMNADGSNVRQITDYSSSSGDPTWSPDGSQIAFTRIALSGDDQGQQNIWIMNANGSDARQITQLDASMGTPHWSPNGRYIAFGAWMQAWIIALDGSEPRSLMDETSVALSLPSWSPDGQRIAYAAGTIAGDGSEINDDGIAIVSPDGVVQKQWTSEMETHGSTTWSPDGRQLAFYGGAGVDPALENPYENVAWQLRVAAPDGSDERSFVTGGVLDVASSPAWRPPVTSVPPPIGPTPTAIPTTATGTDRLYVVTSNGVTVADPATDDEIYSIDAVNPDAALSPDGSRLYVLGAGDIFQLTAFDAADGTELWSAPVEDRIRWIGDHGPSTFAVSPDGNHIYLATSSAPDVQKIQVLDANTGAWSDETDPIIGYCPAMLHPSQDGNSLFLVCQRSSQVHEINLQTLALPTGSSGRTASGANVGAAMSPDGTFLYVAASTSSTYNVTRIQADGSTEGGTLERRTGVLPLLGEMVTLSPDGARLYVAIGTEDNDGDSGTQDVREIAVLDTTSWDEVNRITLDVPLKGGAFTISPDGQYIYASERLQLESDGKLVRIDVESGETTTVLVRNAEILRVLTATPRQPVDPAPPTPPVEQEEGAPPQATLSFGDVSQSGQFAYGCMWAGDPDCADVAGLLFPEQVMRVPAGTELTFTVEGMTDLVNVQANAFLLNGDANVDNLQGKPFLIYPPPPASGLAVSPSSTEPKFVADLPPGEYAISIDVRNSSSESATYGFHIAIPDETGNVPPGIETEPFDATEFDRYPVWSLGDTFGEFVLDRIDNHDRSGNDSVEYTYVAEDGRTDVGITIVSQGPLSEAELQERQESRQGLGEPVIVNGVDGWMTRVDDNARTIELDLDDGYLTIFASEQETALAAAEAVQQVNEP